MTQNQFEINDIIIWQHEDRYCIRIIIDIDMINQEYYLKTIKYYKCDALSFNKIEFGWTHRNYTKLTDLEKIKYL